MVDEQKYVLWCWWYHAGDGDGLPHFLLPGQSVHLQSTHLQASPFLPQPQSDHCDDDDEEDDDDKEEEDDINDHKKED